MNNTQQEIILQVLEKLKPYWDLAEGLSAFVKSVHITTDSLDAITIFLLDAVKNIQNDIHQERLNNYKKTKQEKEKSEKEKELNEIKGLLDTIT